MRKLIRINGQLRVELFDSVNEKFENFAHFSRNAPTSLYFVPPSKWYTRRHLCNMH